MGLDIGKAIDYHMWTAKGPILIVDNKQLIVTSKESHYAFDIYTHCIEWNVFRLIWIGFYKNENNEKCFIPSIPKDVLIHIMSFLGTLLFSKWNAIIFSPH